MPRVLKTIICYAYLDMMDFVSPAYGTKPRNIKRVVLGWSVFGSIFIVTIGSIWYVQAEKRRIAAEAARPKAIVSGTILDQRQMVVGDVRLEIINDQGQSVTKTQSFANGSYQFVLDPGLYQIVATAGNFQTSKQIYLVQNSNQKADIQVRIP